MVVSKIFCFFSPILPGKSIQFDELIFFKWVGNNQLVLMSENSGVLREQLSQCLSEDAAAAYEARLSDQEPARFFTSVENCWEEKQFE